MRLLDDEALARGIAAGFLKDDLPQRLRALKTSLEQNDLRAAEDQAHAIHGAAANMGGMALSAIAFELEQAGEAGRADTMAALVPELERQCERLTEAMEAWQEGRNAG